MTEKKYFIKDLINDKEYISINGNDFIQLLNGLKQCSNVKSYYVIKREYTKKFFISDDEIIGYCIY